MGAVAVKNAVYVLPASDQSLEDFQWLAEEIRQDGGVAIIAEARFLGGLTDADLAAQFAAQSGEAYGELVARLRLHLKLDRAAARKRGMITPGPRAGGED